jgi:hypothetical protein
MPHAWPDLCLLSLVYAVWIKANHMLSSVPHTATLGKPQRASKFQEMSLAERQGAHAPVHA